MFRLLKGDARATLASLPDASVQTCITSPPYWGLRNYATGDAKASEIGNEATLEAHIQNIVDVFREVKRVLRPDGTLWLNEGDRYSNGTNDPESSRSDRAECNVVGHRPPPGFKPKDLLGLPWRIAFALQADGWYLRCDIIWHKPQPLPESVKDRPTRAHEYVFLFSKQAQYFYDSIAIHEPCSENTNPRVPQALLENPVRADTQKHKDRRLVGLNDARVKSHGTFSETTTGLVPTRNKRSVWTIPTEGYSGAHFATFPTDLVRLCCLAGTSAHGCCADCGAPWQRILSDGLEKRTQGWGKTCRCSTTSVKPCTVLDPFVGSGTTSMVAVGLGRRAIGCENNPDYWPLIQERMGLFA